MKKQDIMAIAKEVAKMLQQGQNPAIKDSLGRKRRPLLYGAKFLFYCNEDDLGELRRICKERLHISISEALREKVDEILKDAGVTPKGKG